MKPFLTVSAWLLCSALVWCPAAWAGDTVWIDVRSAEEYTSGHVAPAINIPHDQIADQIGALELAPDQEIKLYCRSGRRSGIALETLVGMGYRNVTNVGGLEDAEKWLAEHSAGDDTVE